MKTIYLDVYFMINFTVDILAVFIALKLIHSKSSVRALVASGILGGLFAVAELFVKSILLHIAISILFIAALIIVCCKKDTGLRKIKFTVFFYISSFLIGGIVSFAYNTLDKILERYPIAGETQVNSRAIVFSACILLIIGVIRLFIMIMSDSINEKAVNIEINIENKSVKFDALIDTGNLVRDPMNMNPVVFVKRTIAEEILPSSVIDLSHIDSLSSTFKKRIRLVPVTRNGVTHVMTGIRVDKVTLRNEKTCAQIDATIVIDKEEGTYGGYLALAPYVAVSDVM